MQDEDTAQGDEDNTPSGQPSSPFQGQRVGDADPIRESPADKEAEATKDAEEPIVGLTRALVRWTAVLGFCAMVAICVSVAQCTEMHSGGTDTHQLASAAEAQANSLSSLASDTGQAATAGRAQALAASDQAAAMAAMASDTYAQLSKLQSSVDAARTAAVAAQSEAATAASALHDVQRAFIVVDALRTSPPTDSDEEGAVLFSPVIQNSGATPATILASVEITPQAEYRLVVDDAKLHTFQFKEFQLSSPFDPQDILTYNVLTVPESILKNYVVGPHGEFVAPENQGASNFGPDEVRKSFSPGTGVGRFYFGAIDYIDIFNTYHVTKYCFRVDGVVHFKGKESVIQPRRCRHWNCTDDQCKADRDAYNREMASSGGPNRGATGVFLP